jgi:hypothetical protein
MAENQRRDEEFYESMPATMGGQTQVRRESEERPVGETDGPSRSLLPWLLIPAALLLGWLLLNALSNRNNASNTGSAGQSQTQQNGSTSGGTGTTGNTQ